ncbi:MAG: hypothetical protein ACI9UJ_001298 [bacterium]|jgi:hypothetical protein
MPIPFMLLMLLMLAIFLASRRIQEKGITFLSQEQKAGLIDLFKPLRSKYPMFVIGLVVVFFANLYFHFVAEELALSVYFFILLAFMIYAGYVSYKILMANAYPSEYIRAFILSTTLRIVALLSLVLGLSMYQ